MRSRNIKPGFFQNENLAECGVEARLLFIGLWCMADREGRLEDRPKKIKISLFPADNIDCDSALNELYRWGFIIRYEANCNKYIQIVNFLRHQRPHIKEAESTIPQPDEHQLRKVQAPTKVSASTDEECLIPDILIPDSLIPDTGYLIPEKKKCQVPRDESRADCVEQIFSHWKERLNHPKAQLGEKRKKLIMARIKDGYSVEDLKEAIDGCARSPYHQGGNASGMIYDTIELICRDAQHIDQFRKIAIDGPPQLSQAGIRTAMAAQEFING